MSDEYLDWLYNGLYLRTNAEGREFRKVFQKNLKSLDEKGAIISITEEMGEVKKIITSSIQIIKPEYYKELWNWRQKLQNLYNAYPHSGDADWLDQNLGKYICRNCGVDLPASLVKDKSEKLWYCSEECRKTRSKRRKKRWREKYPERHKLSQR